MAYWKRKQDNGRNSSNGSSIVHYKKPMEDVGIVEELLLKLDVICREKANSAPTLTSPPTFIDLQIYKICLLKLTLNDKKTFTISMFVMISSGSKLNSSSAPAW